MIESERNIKANRGRLQGGGTMTGEMQMGKIMYLIEDPIEGERDQIMRGRGKCRLR